MKRREIFSGNWKMHKNLDESIELVKGIAGGIGDIGEREVVIFPPAVYVRDLVAICSESPIEIGVQNMYYEEQGAFTGEISPRMVKDIGAKYILIGHSERRHVFGETDEEVNKKVQMAFEFNLEPFICVGELLEEREGGKSEEVVKIQIERAFQGIDEDKMRRSVIAYEPVWAIGTGKVATPEIADSMHNFIRTIIKEIYGEAISTSIPILYGGSVKPDNIEGLYAKENIDGVLVGGASLSIDSFLDIIRVR
jgi:triosephosphate isomerase